MPWKRWQWRQALKLFRSTKLWQRLLETIGLDAYMHEPASILSYGQSKPLELTISFMIDADTVLLDEPSAGINPSLQTKVNDWIREENKDGKEFFIIEHNMEVVMNLCQHLCRVRSCLCDQIYHLQKTSQREPW